ncbi:MAG: hypothetical protein WC941_08775 [Candidatus Bathyarchaeia archaeon]
MVEPYYHVRFRWDEPLDLERTKTMLSGSFRVTVVATPHEAGGLVYQSGERGEVKVAADTLSARLEPYRAVLYQREAKPFTRLDLALRSEVAHLYDKMGPYRSAPIPEPSFAVEK